MLERNRLLTWDQSTVGKVGAGGGVFLGTGDTMVAALVQMFLRDEWTLLSLAFLLFFLALAELYLSSGVMIIRAADIMGTKSSWWRPTSGLGHDEISVTIKENNTSSSVEYDTLLLLSKLSSAQLSSPPLQAVIPPEIILGACTVTDGAGIGGVIPDGVESRHERLEFI